jgi:hypothetical protein
MPSPADLTKIEGEFSTALVEARSAMKSRAVTIADVPNIRVIVETDMATAVDQNMDERAIQPHENETVEIGQVKKDKTVASIIKLPASSPAAPKLDRPGPQTAPAQGGLYVTHVEDVAPKYGTIDHGVVAVTLLVPTAPFSARLEQLGVPARLELDGQMVASTKAPLGNDRHMQTEGTNGVRVIAQVRNVGISPVQIAGGGVALVGLVLAALLWRKKDESAAPPQKERISGFEKTAVGEGVTTAPLKAHAGPISVAMKAEAGPGQFGRYTVIRKLGAGGMADVFLARVSGEAGFEKQVALKIMHRNLTSQPQVVEHFLDEARLASRLTHPNIVQIADLGKQDDDYYIAMEYVDGYDLSYLMYSSRQRGTMVPAKIGLAIIRKICDGLHFAHMATHADGQAMDLVHRDVKAENVLISKTGAVKVADFGIARANQRAVKTQLGMVKGTAAYMSPQQRVGATVDRTADVYGVGAIAYELLSGTEINLDLANLAHLGVEGWPHLAPPSTVRPELPAELDKVVFKALAYEPADRYPTCAAFEEALEAVAEKTGLAASDKAVTQWVEGEISLLQKAG